jgi:hypothetical protein
MVFRQREWQTFEFFATRQWVRVPVYAVGVSMYRIRSSYRHLKKLHKYHYLHRGRDICGRLVYRLSPRGAKWLLKNRHLRTLN